MKNTLIQETELEMVKETGRDDLQPAFIPLCDNKARLDGVIAIHSTTLGPGAGGCRFWSYPARAAMEKDAARLARGMTYKNAMANLPLGGAKAVLQRPEGDFDRVALFEAFGRAIQELEGRYVTAEDVGTSISDMEAVATQTRHVAGLSAVSGKPSGDPSPWTARGVFVSMRHTVETHLGRSLADCTVAIQGVGHVGEALAQMLHQAGARLIVADVNRANVDRCVASLGAEAVSPEDILQAQADVLAPCALGGVLNDQTINSLTAKLVCGAANNQLETEEDGDRLANRGILYAPDYVVNAGGIINVAAEYLGWSSDKVEQRVNATSDRLASVYSYATEKGLTPSAAADAMARDIVASAAMPEAVLD